MKKIFLHQSVAQIGSEYPEVKDISERTVNDCSSNSSEKEDRETLLKSYIVRLNLGEDLESVRKDFVKAFESVDASEIAQAEQTLIQEGTPVEEIQQLCDIHSALFHGKTTGEQNLVDFDDAVKALEAYLKIKGHPIAIFVEENKVIQNLIQKVREVVIQEDKLKVRAALEELQKLTLHYSKKGDLIYPLLHVKYGFSGPSDVMWSVDDEIRDEVKRLTEVNEIEAYFETVQKVIDRAEEMIYKENNILYPLIIKHFSEDDFMQLYYELRNYDTLLDENTYPLWEEAEHKKEALRIIGGRLQSDIDAEDNIRSTSEKIVLGSGAMTGEELYAMLNTIPMEITFVDKNDINAFFNDGEKLFKRPDMAIGRNVESCHPPKIKKMVKEIISRFKAGTQDVVHVAMKKAGRPVSVKYFAVRNEKGEYLGTLECVQDLAEFRDILAKL